MNATLARYAPWMLGLLRVVTALVFMEHGTQKLFRFPPQMRFGGGSPGGRQSAQAVVDTAASAAKGAIDTATSAMSSIIDTASSLLSSTPPEAAAPAGPGGPGGGMGALFLVAGILETFGGLAILLGLFTRPIGFILAGEAAVIFWWMHVGGMGGGAIYPVSNGGEAAVLYCFTFLYLVFAGPGAFALDNVLFRKRVA
ncbi:MAG: DoxX family protein [Devosia sp.]